MAALVAEEIWVKGEEWVVLRRPLFSIQQSERAIAHLKAHPGLEDLFGELLKGLEARLPPSWFHLDVSAISGSSLLLLGIQAEPRETLHSLAQAMEDCADLFDKTHDWLAVRGIWGGVGAP
ncbi:hypothetical protein IIA79_07090 [bacterium]|nr:hypothetical protein [bacterium]